ncbi:MAG: protein kinase [Acidobacteria bacterium]|nr:protein kinase [Acidobacteriota bacterium]
MTAERWRQVEDLFHEALDRAPNARGAFLDLACADDQALHEQVEGLLASYDDAGDFIEKPVMDDSLSSEAKASRPSESIIGHKIGNYEILSLLGAGGMGEVYLARDVRLDRQIALKILPAQFTQDPAQVERFEREARAASALNHPNIITIFEVGQEGSTHFIATEFIAGRTLRQTISEDKTPLGEALKVAVQIASALATAHTAGIVHRDIKPENVMVRDDGLVKLLDFGLAKPLKAATTTGNLQKPEAVSLQTDPRLLMGTLAYLSPEQACGEKVDHRTDIFSLGVVIYEMATGARPFRGDDPSAILTAIQDQPLMPITSWDAGLPGELERILRRALAKDRAARYQTVAELRDDLQRLEQKLSPASAGEAASQKRPPAQWRRRRVTAALALGGVAVFAAAWLWTPGENDAPPPELWGKARPLTRQAGSELFPSLAADGQSFIYASNASGNWDIYRQYVNGATVWNLTADYADHDTQPALSPDNSLIVFRSERDGGGIFVMSAQGGQVRKLSDKGYHPAWSPDGQEIIYTLELVDYPRNRRLPPDGLWAINVASARTRQISDQDIAMPQWSPHGRRIAYWGQRRDGQRDIWTIPASGGAPVEVTNDEDLDWNPVWSPDGKYLYFASDRKGTMDLWRVAIDEQSGKMLGQLEQVRTPSNYGQHFSFSRDGRSLAYAELNTQKDLRRIAFDPGRGLAVGEPDWVKTGSRWVMDHDISPDGAWLVCSSGGDEQEDLFIISSDGMGGRRPLTSDTSKDRGPRWAPDGKQIAFYSDRGGTWNIWTINADGSGLRQLTFNAEAKAYFPIWSPDGKRLVYTNAAGAPFMIEVARPWQEQTPQPLLLPTEPQVRFWVRAWSGDGLKMAGGWRRISENKLTLVSYSFATRQFEPLTKIDGDNCVWLNDNRRILYLHDGKIFLVDSENKKTQEVLSVAPHKITHFVISRDNRQLYFDVDATEADIWMLSLK